MEQSVKLKKVCLILAYLEGRPFGTKEDAHNPGSLTFKLFSKQVGGHSCFLKCVEIPTIILKPVNRLTELEFYQRLGNYSELSPFVPRFVGSITFPKRVDVDISLVEPIQSCYAKLGSASPGIKQTPPRAKRKDESEEFFDASSRRFMPITKKQWFSKMVTKRYNKNVRDYLVLEDLTSFMISPCTLDIKMGSKPFNPKKLESQSKKFLESTSSRLGFRLCGMQIYQSSTKRYTFRDKYWGRTIDEQNVIEAFRQFFSDGSTLKRKIIGMFTKELEKLEHVLQDTRGLIFCSCSLLFLYDGNLTEEEIESSDPRVLNHKVKVRLIDFEHIVYTLSLIHI
eukprot:TRINITY_DN10709_c0_g1_i14.p1 TRINITY_DN10709_c0_g1~~TRINITY_DN10709_c0_g1_i14.p1  ORF type:complete len:339 (-),score=47.52 TRINITY_DN10709_c0_g1_i14:62-1078(-)